MRGPTRLQLPPHWSAYGRGGYQGHTPRAFMAFSFSAYRESGSTIPRCAMKRRSILTGRGFGDNLESRFTPAAVRG